MRLCTLVYPVRVPQIFLAVNLEGEDKGLYGGFEGEYHRDNVGVGMPAAARIFRELCGGEPDLKDPNAVERVAIVNYFRGDERESIYHAFFVRNWRGELCSPQKMGKPEAFDIWGLPLKKMSRKQGDWLKRVVEGERAVWDVMCDSDNRFLRCERVGSLPRRPSRLPK